MGEVFFIRVATNTIALFYVKKVRSKSYAQKTHSSACTTQVCNLQEKVKLRECVFIKIKTLPLQIALLTCVVYEQYTIIFPFCKVFMQKKKAPK